MKTRWMIFAMALCGLTFLPGCGGDNTVEEVGKMNSTNINRLANLYSAFQNGVSGGGSGGPKDESEFRKYIQNYPADKLKMMGVDTSNLDGLFKSERDGKPFKIRYKVGGGRGSPASPVVFETEGKGGKKQVGFAGNTTVEDCDQATYEGYMNGKTPSPGGRPSGPPAGAPKGPQG